MSSLFLLFHYFIILIIYHLFFLCNCFICYRMRLEKTAQLAKQMNFDYFTTTLTISPLKKSVKLNEIGYELGNTYGVEYLLSDFKKKEGYKRSIELSKEYSLYRQNYCGCVFSKTENENSCKEKTVILK